MKRRRIFPFILLFAGIVVVTVVVLTVLNRRNPFNQAMPVETYTVTRSSLVEHVTGTGTFEARDSSTVYPRVSGTVKSVLVAVGDRVRAGDPLITIDASDYALALEQAQSALENTRRSVRQSLVTLRAQYRSASTSFDQANRQYTKNQQLFAAKAISEDDLKQSQNAYDTAQVSLQSAREQLNLRLGQPLGADPILDSSKDEQIVATAPEVVQARVSVDTAQNNLNKCTVRAPINGTVTKVVPSVGDLASPSVAVAEVQTISSMVAKAQIDEVDIGKLSVGNSADVTSDSLLGETLHGTITQIDPTIDSTGSTRVTTVTIELNSPPEGSGQNDPGAKLRVGASCSVNITTRTRENVLSIPITAFETKNGVDSVLRLAKLPTQEPGRPSLYRLLQVTITTGISTVDSIEVQSGLSEGDLIATGNLNQLRGGMTVVAKGKL